MTTQTATNARKSLLELSRGANERHEVYRIGQRQDDAVLMSETEYESLVETLDLLSTLASGSLSSRPESTSKVAR